MISNRFNRQKIASKRQQSQTMINIYFLFLFCFRHLSFENRHLVAMEIFPSNLISSFRVFRFYFPANSNSSESQFRCRPAPACRTWSPSCRSDRRRNSPAKSFRTERSASSPKTSSELSGSERWPDLRDSFRPEPSSTADEPPTTAESCWRGRTWPSDRSTFRRCIYRQPSLGSSWAGRKFLLEVLSEIQFRRRGCCRKLFGLRCRCWERRWLDLWTCWRRVWVIISEKVH